MSLRPQRMPNMDPDLWKIMEEALREFYVFHELNISQPDPITPRKSVDQWIIEHPTDGKR